MTGRIVLSPLSRIQRNRNVDSSELRAVAHDLVEFSKDYDPYGFSDNGTDEDAFAEVYGILVSGGADSFIPPLEEIAGDPEEDPKWRARAMDLVHRLEVLG